MKDITIDDGFETLKEILDKLDDDNISLEDSFELYDQGLKMVKKINDKLDETEKKIIILNEESGRNE